MSTPAITSVAPFFIVRDLSRALAFYRLKLGFQVMYEAPQGNPFFAIVARDGAMLMLKCIETPPLPNSERHPDARWGRIFQHARSRRACERTCRSRCRLLGRPRRYRRRPTRLRDQRRGRLHAVFRKTALTGQQKTAAGKPGGGFSKPTIGRGEHASVEARILDEGSGSPLIRHAPLASLATTYSPAS